MPRLELVLAFIDYSRHVIGVLLWITYLFGFLFWISIHGLYFFWRRTGVRTTFTVHFIAGWGLAYGVVQYRGILLGTDWGWNPVLTCLFLLLLIFTFYLELHTRRMLKFKTLAGIPELCPDHPESKLLTEGIYAKIRNPRYVLVFLHLIGWALLVNYSGVYALVVWMFFLIQLAVRLEERELRDRFGKPYMEYCQNVPQFLPKWKSFFFFINL